MAAEVLYTPEVLALAVALSDYPPDDTLPMAGEARSRSCGSTLKLQLATDDAGRIAALGCEARACAVGQAAAAIFARGAVGRDRQSIAAGRHALAGWLTDTAEAPDWPGIALLDPARRYPARHGAILLPWDAALAALADAALPDTASANAALAPPASSG